MTSVKTEQLAGAPGRARVLVVAESGAIILAELGAGLALTSAAPARLVTTARTYNALLVGIEKSYALPDGARNPVVYLNGLRQAESVDYQLEGGKITPLWEWPTDSQVRADFE